ncbi:MAG: hypothetical protein J6A75_05125 [Lachnospiraceae bacterium]|nr:hypothetical protein [Lachnospiraceae bacterium]
MKRIRFLMLVLFLLLGHSNRVLAAEKITVFCEEINLVGEEALRIPVEIKENTGIMGFKIHIEYPKDLLSILGTESGEVTKKGSLSDNAGNEEGKTDVLWTGTADAKGDGVLFYILLKPHEVIQEDVTLKLSYSQGDTFNEKWEDVVLDCKDITLLAKKDEEQNTETAYVAEDIETYVEEKNISEFVEDASCSFDNTKILHIMQQKLEENSIPDFQTGEKKAIENAAEEVLTALEKEGVAVAETIKTYEPEKKIQAVKTLYETVYSEAAEIECKKNDSKGSSTDINGNQIDPALAVLLSGCIVLAVIYVIIRKREGK